jgi:flagellar hook-associated protein 1 FlgK
MSLFSSLNTGYSGLNINQSALSTTTNNISNASNPDYTRERARIVSQDAIHTHSGDIGMGAKLQTVIRIKNEFLFNRYEAENKNLNYFKTLQQNMDEIVSFFPDVKDVGLNKDIQNYFDSWNHFANNPNDNSAKVDLASKTQTLANTIKETRKKIDDLKVAVNKKIKSFVNEINGLIKDIANLTKEIKKTEANNINHANILRDKRDKAEKRLIELTGARVQKNNLTSSNLSNNTSIDFDKNYTINLGGYPLVDNSTYHPIEVKENPKSSENMYSIYFQKQDYTEVDITKNIPKQSVIGGLLEFRGTTYDEKGKITDGISGKYINELDAFASTLIQNTNSIYSYSAEEKATGEQLFKPVSLTDNQINKYPLNSKIVEESLIHPVRKGDLTLSAYDNNGNFVKDVKISIDPTKTLKDNLNNINDTLSNNNIDYEAVIQNGNIAFEKKDNDGNGSLDNGALLVKDDGSLLFDAMNDVQFKPINKANNINFPLPIKDGTFDIVAYNDNGDELARRTITINSKSKDPMYSTLEGVLSQINMPNIDDNNDNDSSNDIDDLYKAEMANGKVIFNKKSDVTTYVGLDNDSSNFGGAVGINKFFSGYDSKTISLDDRFVKDASLIHAYKAPNDGNNDVANEMVQFQYDDVEFKSKNGDSVKTTISGYYKYITSNIANDSDRINTNVDSHTAIFNSIQKEYQNESGVNIDEEMTNLMKYQRGYEASAKVITTINKMFDTLLSIKN